MKAMILCAGKGTRLRPLTYSMPKPMIPLVDKPVMQHIVEHLVSYGVDEIAVNLSYLPDRIHDFFRDGGQFGARIFYSYEGELKDGEFVGEAIGSGGGLKKIQKETGFFDDTFIVLCGDAALTLDIRAIVAEHKKRGALASIVLKNVDQNEVNKYGIVALDDDGRITKFQEKPSQEEAVSTLANTGIYIFEPEALDFIPDDEEYDLGGDLFPRLSQESDRLYGAVCDFDWLDIGNLSDFRDAHGQMLNACPAGLSLPGIEIAPDLRVGANVVVSPEDIVQDGPVYIGSGSRIGRNVKFIGPVVIGHNCEIGDNAIIHQSILGDHVRVRANTLLTEAIVYNGYIINKDGVSSELSDGGAVCDARLPEISVGGDNGAIADLNIVERSVREGWSHEGAKKRCAS